MAAPASTSPPPCYLLELPPELRNHIYRDTLCQNEDIHINKDTFAQPGLLRVCRRTRAEASAIYYQENRFCLDALDFSPNVTINFWKHAKHFLTTEDDRSNLDLGSKRQSWSNLLQWLKAFHEGRTILMYDNGDGDYDEEWAVAAGAFGIVSEVKAMEWSKVLGVLLRYKKATRHAMISWD